MKLEKNTVIKGSKFCFKMKFTYPSEHYRIAGLDLKNVELPQIADFCLKSEFGDFTGLLIGMYDLSHLCL